MAQARRAQRHESTREEIKQVARQQIAAQGAAALSLRAIARAMGMTAPALYRYFASRDDLVTALIVDAYTALGDAMAAARAAEGAGAHARRVLAMGMAYRAWAIAHPQDYALIFGTPIPGYEAPAAVTMPAAKRSMDLFVETLAEAWAAGALAPTPPYAAPPADVRALLARWRDSYGYTAPTPVLHLALVGWSRMHGLVLLEIFDHLAPFWGDPAHLFRSELGVLLAQGGLEGG